jgi:hypothetical protein
MIDRMKDGTLTWDPDVFGFSSGVVGLQLFTNKKYDAKKWPIDKYLDDASSVEPPYLVGMACTVCHTAFNPNRPPKNPAEPKIQMQGGSPTDSGGLFKGRVGQRKA